MLEPIDSTNLTIALDLLERGFPRRSRAFWEWGIERITRYNAPSAPNSIGQLLVVKGSKVGVMLTPQAQSRGRSGQPRNVTNLSSWYVEPDHRFLAPLMLREMVRDSGTVFTDLTPSKDVVRMLPGLGFKPLNAGISAIPLPLAAIRHRGAGRVSSFSEIAAGSLPDDDASFLEHHAAFGATAAVLSVDRRHYPLLFISRTVRHIPTAELIYCDDTALLMKELGAIARFLLKQGKLILFVDIPLDFKVPGAHFVGRGLKFAKGEWTFGGTDFAGSELLLLGR
jgi:hypothetical protein